jgi:UDP-N-acetylmuramate: L-alanyl-gamma-D-glutamyl-meso-diaminopimelate ligase
MHVHILGICGTFMGGIAALASEKGHRVTGCDAQVYPPMSTQLQALGIELIEGYDAAQVKLNADCYIIGNALSRGNLLVEEILNRNLNYVSGPEWLAKHILQDRWVMAISGTHGKTTTTSMIAHILQHCGHAPGFLVGGIPANFGRSARLGNGQPFVVEADEYDTAFFDKRSKFIHYHPRTLIINNLEFDHADIFADLAAIQTQFHHLVRTVPALGQIIYPKQDQHVAQVLAQGYWSKAISFGIDCGDWRATLLQPDGSRYRLRVEDNCIEGEVDWAQIGEHNVLNGLAALTACTQIGIPIVDSMHALTEFKGVKRRLELVAEINDIRIYDDFAHHPTAIRYTLDAMRRHASGERIIALIEPRSNTMRMGVHQTELARSFSSADKIMLYASANLNWDLNSLVRDSVAPITIFSSIDDIVRQLSSELTSGDSLVVMSNGGFAGVLQLLIDSLKHKYGEAC